MGQAYCTCPHRPCLLYTSICMHQTQSHKVTIFTFAGCKLTFPSYQVPSTFCVTGPHIVSVIFNVSFFIGTEQQSLALKLNVRASMLIWHTVSGILECSTVSYNKSWFSQASNMVFYCENYKILQENINVIDCCFCILFRNTAVDLIEQELVFTGNEHGLSLIHI